MILNSFLVIEYIDNNLKTTDRKTIIRDILGNLNNWTILPIVQVIKDVIYLNEKYLV